MGLRPHKHRRAPYASNGRAGRTPYSAVPVPVGLVIWSTHFVRPT